MTEKPVVALEAEYEALVHIRSEALEELKALEGAFRGREEALQLNTDGERSAEDELWRLSDQFDGLDDGGISALRPLLVDAAASVRRTSEREIKDALGRVPAPAQPVKRTFEMVCMLLFKTVDAPDFDTKAKRALLECDVCACVANYDAEALIHARKLTEMVWDKYLGGEQRAGSFFPAQQQQWQAMASTGGTY
eukprot:CAMPEP_0206263016 /NCGR_PEP_ID=MMETSP0047_2-20121206/28579_1 /ASSEMBLY_ACC=CAM_ASM_000192 /TAXON_ID=195065 /ORGANISM="Chroomonas mesostigmatica_cf, Strain CCMP1168" /LENGTH=193 /DNA_ID=CAMNT_0053690501 /DNA_START=119 /DNA_END=697 /DNA_ORIENTATION=+